MDSKGNIIVCVLAAVFFLYTSNLTEQIEGTKRTRDIWTSLDDE